MPRAWMVASAVHGDLAHHHTGPLLLTGARQVRTGALPNAGVWLVQAFG
jgi:hypothetical protein